MSRSKPTTWASSRLPSACSTRQRWPVMRRQPRLSSSRPETRTRRPLTLASGTASRVRRASSRRKASPRAISVGRLEVLAEGFHAAVQALLAADVGLGLGGDHPAFAEGQALVRHQAPARRTLRRQFADARALLGIEQDLHLVLVAGHGRQGLLGQGQQLGRMQGQLAADDLLGHLLHQLQQLLLAAQLEGLGELAEFPGQPVQRPCRRLEYLAALAAPFLAALALALLAALLETFLAAGLAALLQALLVALVEALLEAVGHRPLQLRRVAVPLPLGQGAGARREAVGPPLARRAADHLDRHRHSTVCSRNSWICRSPSAAMSRTTAMMSLRTCSTRLSGTGPWRRLRFSICCAWRFGSAPVMALTSAGSAPLRATTHSSRGMASSSAC